MRPKAPRLPARVLPRLARGAFRALRVLRAGVVLVALGGASGATAQIVSAEYADPTTRYPHAVLGDGIEHGSLRMTLRDGRVLQLRLPQARVFEDTAPRLADLDGDGDAEVIVVESHAQQGAQLSVYDETGKIAATPHIGRRFRWLAPIGAGDLDGDGRVEIAYIDRPHLAKTLMVWRFEDNTLTLVAKQAGLTNHRIGERDIAGGIRDCGSGPEMITASGDWSRLMATRLEGGVLETRAIGAHEGRRSFRRALRC